MGVRLLLIGVALLLAPTLAVAWNEPDGFRDVPFGASEAELMAKLGPKAPTGTANVLGCKTMSQGERTCWGWVRVADVHMDAFFSFRADRFRSVLLTFKTDDFDTIQSVFIERYGPPTKSEDRPVVSGAGGRYMNRIYGWEGPKAYITLRRFGSTLHESAAMIGATSDLAESERLRQEKARKAKKDL